MSVKQALAGGGLILASITFVVGMLFGEGAEPVENAGELASRASGEPQCMTDWIETKGEEPDVRGKFRVCTSPDKRYVITIRENQAPVGYDGAEGRFLTDSEVAGLLK